MSVDPEDPAVAAEARPSAWPLPDWRPPTTPEVSNEGSEEVVEDAPPWPDAPLTSPPADAHPATSDRPLWPIDPWPSPHFHVERPTPMPDIQPGPAPSGLRAYLEQQPAVTPSWDPAAPNTRPTPSARSDRVPNDAPPAIPPLTEAPPPAPQTASTAPPPGAPFGSRTTAPLPIHFTPDRLVKPKAPAPGRGLRRLLYKMTAGRLNLGRSAAEQAHMQLVARVRTPAATGRRRVAFVSLKGGVGKTTTTVMLGHTLATYRGDNVIAIDANPDAGNLATRVPRQTPAASRDLLRAAGSLERYADVRSFTSQAGSRLQVLAGESDPALSEAFSAGDYSAVLTALERFYSIILTDCGTGILHDAMRAVLWYADQLVIITSPALDSAQALDQLLEWLDRHGYHHLVQPAVVVVNAVRRGSEVGASDFITHFGPRCRAVVSIPYDKALSIGGEVDLTDLDAKTQRAYLDLAAAVGDGFTTPRLEGH